MVYCSYNMLCKGTGYAFKLVILIQFPRGSEVSELKDWSCSVAYFGLSNKKQWCRNWKLLDVQAVTDCWPCCHLVRDRMMLHEPGQASNCLNLSMFRKTKFFSINLRYFLMLNRAEGLFSGMYIVQGAQVVSAEGCFHHSPCWTGEGRQYRSQPPFNHLSSNNVQKLLHFPVTVSSFHKVKDRGCDLKQQFMQPKKKDASTWTAMKGVPGFPIDCASCSLERVGWGGLSAFSRLLRTEPIAPSSSKGNLPLSYE